MQTIIFRTATVTIENDSFISTFNDGKQNHFDLGWVGSDEGYVQIAKDMGYNEPREYAITHELGHHFIADNLGWKYSWALWTNTWFDEPWPDHIAWEEHIVNKFQRYVRTQTADEHGVLELIFRNQLDNKAFDFRYLCCEVRNGRSFAYDATTGNLTTARRSPS